MQCANIANQELCLSLTLESTLERRFQTFSSYQALFLFQIQVLIPIKSFLQEKQMLVQVSLIIKICLTTPFQVFILTGLLILT